MRTEADLIPLPTHLHTLRDRLRVVNHELVHYTRKSAQTEAVRVRHPVEDYEYAIHAIRWIDDNTGQIFISKQPFFSSEARLGSWVEYYEQKEAPAGAGLVRRWFSDPAHLVATVLALPYGLTLLGMVALGDRSSRKDQQKRSRALARFGEMPKFWST